MKSLPNFQRDFQKFVRDECRAEGDNILKSKDAPLSEFGLEELNAFNNTTELESL